MLLRPNQIPTPQVENLMHHKQKPSTVKITMNEQQLQALMMRLGEYKPATLFRPGLSQVGDYVRQRMIPEVFAKEGPGWEKLSRRSRRERTAQGFPPTHPILIRTKDLYNELTQKSHPNHIEIIRVGRVCRVEIGGSSKKFIDNQLGRVNDRLPARPMIPGTGNVPMMDKDRAYIRNILRKSISQQLTKTL